MSGNLSQVKFTILERQSHEKANSLMVIPPKYGKILVFISFSLVYISLVGSVTIANVQIEWSYLTNFNRIQDGACLNQAVVRT